MDSYLVLARKWRPASFADVVGQQHIVRSLQNAVEMNRLAGAYLFSGMRGVGKTSMARILAKTVNCEKGATITPCGECANCKEIANGSCLDVMEIDAASNRGIDEMREIRDHLAYAPVKCRQKIYIIDEVHMLTREAFNAFLKSLEEPPPNTTFILATTEQNRVPETILSRCQCFEFRALTETQIADKLADIAKKEKIGVSDGTLRLIAKRAEGSMRDAQSLLDQAATYSAEEQGEENMGIVLGFVSREKIWSLLTAISEKNPDATLQQLRDLYYAGYEIKVLIKELFEAVRTILITKVTAEPEKILTEPKEVISSAGKIAEKNSVGKLQQFFDILLKAEAQSRIAGSPISVLEMALIKMIRMDDVVPVGEILHRLKNLPAVQGAPVMGGHTLSAAKPSVAQPPTAKPPVTPEWDKIKEAIIAKRPSMIGILNQITSFSVEGDKAVFVYPTGQEFAKKQCEESRELIEGVIMAQTGKKLQLCFRLGAGAQKTDSAKKRLDNSARKEMLSDPLVQKAVDMFNGQPGFDDENGKPAKG